MALCSFMELGSRGLVFVPDVKQALVTAVPEAGCELGRGSSFLPGTVPREDLSLELSGQRGGGEMRGIWVALHCPRVSCFSLGLSFLF